MLMKAPVINKTAIFEYYISKKGYNFFACISGIIGFFNIDLENVKKKKNRTNYSMK